MWELRGGLSGEVQRCLFTAQAEVQLLLLLLEFLGTWTNLHMSKWFILIKGSVPVCVYVTTGSLYLASV